MRPLASVLFGGILVLGAIGAAQAQQSDRSASGTASSSTQSSSTIKTQGTVTAEPVQAEPNTQTEMNATTGTGASADADAPLNKVRERAKSASSTGRAAVDKQLKQISKDVDAEAEAKGAAVAAGRVASEFGLTGDALVDEALQFDAGLGEVIIAHTLMANSKTTVTMEQIFALRAEGMGWGQIAQGLDLRLGEVVSAVRSESKVAQGAIRADGKVATIRSGASTHANAKAGANAGVQAGHTGASASGVGVGVGTKLGK